MTTSGISVVAEIDICGKHVRLIVTGRLTEETQQALHPLIRRARALSPVTRVVVDLTGAEHIEASAVQSLTENSCQYHTGHPSQQVRLTLPEAFTVVRGNDPLHPRLTSLPRRAA